MAFKSLSTGKVVPSGWIKKVMKRDLEVGFVGHLDELIPDLFAKDDIYLKDRLTAKVQNKELGVTTIEEECKAQYLWWNSETQSNWFDGFLRHAILLSSDTYMKKATEKLNHLLSSQDADGYIGIYDSDLRYNFNSENGELWAQCTLFRSLLAYYSATLDKSVLTAVIRAIDVTMKAWPTYTSRPFKARDSFAGLCHGLVITDVLNELYDITSNIAYLEYAVWLYESYSFEALSESDIQLNNLLALKVSFKGHGVHTYEHLRSLLIAYRGLQILGESYSGKLTLHAARQALANYFVKLSNELTVSGAPIGDEWIHGRIANSTSTGYEYCSVHELFHSYCALFKYTVVAPFQYADRAEWLFYNAALGARHPSKPSIAYLKTDNSYSMLGRSSENEFKTTAGDPEIRYKYSPTHQDAAVCCVPNAGRIFPYFVENMWLQDENGLTAMLYGPCTITTVVLNRALRIEEHTNYPHDLKINFKISLSQPTQFNLTLRIPSWASAYHLFINGSEGKHRSKGDSIVINSSFKDGDTIELQFEAELILNISKDNEYYLSYGPMIFAMPIDHEEIVTKAYDLNSFADTTYCASSENFKNLKLKPEKIKSFTLKHNTNDTNKGNSLELVGELFNSETQIFETVTFVPMGGTLLRKVTFK